MRRTHLGGDKLFVDYAGDTASVVIDRLTGEIKKAQISVAVLAYAEATWTQSLADWISAHTRAFEAIGGVTRLLVPDNTKTAVIKACLYELKSTGPIRRWQRITALACCPEAAQATRQGQSQSRRADHGTLDSGPPAQSAIP